MGTSGATRLHAPLKKPWSRRAVRVAGSAGACRWPGRTLSSVWIRDIYRMFDAVTSSPCALSWTLTGVRTAWTQAILFRNVHVHVHGGEAGVAFPATGKTYKQRRSK